MEAEGINQILEMIAGNSIQTVALIFVALYFKKINEENRADNKEREKEGRERENTLINKLQTVNDTNKDLANVSYELTKTNAEIAKTNSLLAKDMKEELCNIDYKLDAIINSPRN